MRSYRTACNIGARTLYNTPVIVVNCYPSDNAVHSLLKLDFRFLRSQEELCFRGSKEPIVRCPRNLQYQVAFPEGNICRAVEELVMANIFRELGFTHADLFSIC